MYKILFLDNDNKIINIANNSKEINKNILYKLAKHIAEKNNNNKTDISELDDKIIAANDSFQYELFFNKENNINIKIIKHKDKLAFNNLIYLENEFHDYINSINIIEAKNTLKKLMNQLKTICG